jgi:hypothetical protein
MAGLQHLPPHKRKSAPVPRNIVRLIENTISAMNSLLGSKAKQNKGMWRGLNEENGYYH